VAWRGWWCVQVAVVASLAVPVETAGKALEQIQEEEEEEQQQQETAIPRPHPPLTTTSSGSGEVQLTGLALTHQQPYA
jgi:hemolysin activation/secretion protein